MKIIETAQSKFLVLAAGVALLLVAPACHKKAAQAPPPPPPPAPAAARAPEKPVISVFAATPASIERGQSSSLRWQVEHATDVRIEPSVGTVSENGNRSIYPSAPTTYTLVAKGPGGTADATTMVTVRMPAPAAAAAPPPAAKPGFEESLSSQVKDVYFDFDKSALRSEAQSTLKSDATALRSIFTDFPSQAVMVEGHCDERGSAEYNMALGQERAQAAKDYLVQVGIPSDQLATISYGKERPVCDEHDEACWQKNRHIHIVAQAQAQE